MIFVRPFRQVALALCWALSGPTAIAKPAASPRTSKDKLRVAVATRLGSSIAVAACMVRTFVEDERLNEAWDITYLDFAADDFRKSVEGLIASKSVDVIISDETSAHALETSKSADVGGVAFFAGTATHPGITAGRPHAMRYVSDSDYYGGAYARFAVNIRKARRVGVVTNVSESFSTNYSDRFMAVASAIDPKVEVQQFKIINADGELDKTLDEIAAKRFDMVYAPIYSVEGYRLLDGLARRGAKPTVLTHVSLLRGTLVPPHGPPIYFNGGLDPSPPRDVSRAFTKIVKKCQANVQVTNFDLFSSASLIDIVGLLRRVLAKEPLLRGRALVAAAHNTPHRGLVGHRRLGADGSVVLPPFFYRIDGEKVSYAATVE